MYSPYSIGSSNIFGNNNILMDQQTTKAIIEKYTARPRSFSEKQVNIIKRHAQHYRIPFAEDEQTWVDHVGGVVKQAVQGYISGFTTINIGEAPQTPAESISRAVGSMAGFIGLTPATPLKMLGAATKSQSLISAGTAMAKARGNSVPLYIANKIMKKGTAIFDSAVAKQAIDGTGAVASAIKFLKNPQASDYISRGLRMGLASGISSWQGGIDQMMKSFLWGASAGTIDATIANAIRMDSKVSEGVIKGLAGAMADGLPATLRGDTTPEQVYYYLRGAYFGATEVPWSKRYANEKILEYKKGGVDRDTFIKGLPKAVRKDFIEGISRVDLTPMTETALREAGLWGKFNEEHKRYVNLEVTKYITDTDDNKATSDNGGDPGQGPVDLHIPPTIRIKNIVESFPDIWRTDGGDNVEAKRRFTDDIMVKHQKTIDEFKSEYNTDPNYYHDKMIEELRSAGYMEDKVPGQVSLELHAIARDAEKTKYSKYFVPTIDFEKDTFEISMSDAIHNRAPNNKILGERYHSNLLDDIIGEFSGGKDTVIRLPNIYVQGARGYEEVPISSAKNPDSREIAFNSNLRDEHKTKLVETANNIDREIYNKYGYIYFGGNNAKIDALYVPFHPEIAAIRNNPQAIDTAFNTLMTNMFESKTMRNASGEEFKSVDDLKKYVLDGLSKSNVMGLDLEKAIYTSHALYEMRMQFGGTKLADTADYYKNFFDDAKLPKDVKAMTKRMQLVMAAGTPLREPYFRDVDRTKLNPLFNDLKTPRILLVKDADLTDANFRIGIDLPGSAERSTDGSVFVLPELMRVESEYTGLGKEVGAIKSVGVAATGTGGTILAKHAEHVAPPALAKIMRENGVTHVVMGTAGKVTGSYNQRMITMDELMAAKFENLQSKVISETRWEDWKVNTGKALTPRKAHKAKFRIPIQSLSMLNGRYGALDGDEVDTVRQIFVDEVIRKNFYGEQASNDKVTEFLNADGKTALKLRQEILNDEILDGIGRQNIMKLILDDRDVSIADKLITRIINENMDSINEKYQDGEMSSMEYESAMREASADSGILSKALYASESATSLLYNPQTRGILDKVINNYIVGAAIRPKISNGMELPIAPYFAKAWGNDPVMKLLNVPVDPTGTIKDAYGNPVQKVYKFALGNSERYKKITRADGKKELLGDIYDRVMQRRKDPEYLSRLSETEKEQALEDVELLRWVIIRTPHSHPSSTIVAELAGFDGMDGPRIYLDQAAMGRLGGADVDIDTVKIFTGSKISEDGKFHGMPARLKDAFNQFEYLAYKVEDDSGQQLTQQPAQQPVQQTKFNWARTAADNYEVSSKGDKTYSAMYAKLKDGRTIEEAYQSAKGSSKGKPAIEELFFDKVPVNLTLSVMATTNGFKDPKEYYFYTKLQKHLGNYKKEASYLVEWIKYSNKHGLDMAKLNPKTSSLIKRTGYLGVDNDNLYIKDSSGKNHAFSIAIGENKNFDYWGTYLGLWKQWAKENPKLIEELRQKASGKTLTDQFAKTENNQARALAEILNETAPKQPVQQPVQQAKSGARVSLIEAKSDVDDMGNRISTQYERFAQVENDPLYSPAMMYARGTRQQIQQMFVTGRNDLGEIANAGGSHMSEAVSFLKQQPDETYKTTINYGGKKATIVYKLREDMMMLALKKYNTALNMAADVTDFNGLKDPADIKYDIFNHAFDIKVTIDGKPASDKDRKTIVLTRGLMRKIASAKQAMYSRNYRANRRFTADEIYSILKDAEDIYGGRTDTLIGAARQAILDADMSIPLITKDNADVVRKVYDRYKELISTQRYAHKMARPSSAVVQTEDVKLFFQNRMWDPAYREQVIDTYSQKAWTNKTVEIVLRQNGVVKRTRSFDGDVHKSSYVLTVEGNLLKMIASTKRKKNKAAEKEISTVLGKYINKKNGREVTFTDADKKILDSAETMMRRDLADIDKLGLQKDRLWRTRFMQEQYRRSERYIANDLYDMVSTMMEHKYINQIPEDLQSQIPHKIGRSIHMLHQKMNEIKNLPGVQRVGEYSIDELHNELRKGLSPEEQKLFDTELFSSMLWGGKGQQDGSKRGVSKSEVTNLGYSLANPPNDIIREYNESILGVLKGKKDIVEVGYEKSPLAKNDGTAEDIMMQVIKNPDMLRTPGGIVDTTGWDNMTAMDLVNKVIPYEVEGDAKSAVLKDPILKKIYYKEMLPEMQELKKHFIDRKITDANDILNLVRGMTGRGVDQNRVGKDPTALTLEEVKMLNRAFRYIEEPQLLVKIFGSKSINYPVIRKLYYYLIPSEIGRDIQRFVWDTKKTQGFWANKYGKAFLGSVEVPTNAIESISEYINMAQSLATKTREDMVRKVGDDMKRYMDHPMFPELFDIAVIKREHTSLVEAIKGQVDMPKDTKLRHLEELDSLYKTANRKLRDIQKLHPDMQVKFSGADGNDVIVNLSPKQIIDNINEVITKNLSDVYDNVISAKMENVNKYAKRFTDGPQKGKIIYIRNPKTNNLTTIPVIDKRAFFADMEKATIENGSWDRDLGIDGVRMIAHSILYQSQYGGLMNKINADEANAFLKLADNNAMTTLKWTQEGYFPHMHSDRARFARDINDYIKDVENDKSMSSDAKKKNIEKYVRNYVRNGANINSEVDVDYLHRYGDIIDSEMKRQDRINKSSDSKLKYLNGISRSGNQMHREYFSLGYSRNIDALYEYMGNMSSVYYRNISQILSRIKIADFTNELAKQYDKKTANNLRNFMHLYAQGAAGYGVTIPEFLVDNPDMKIKGTLYHMYSDSVITDKINKISTKLGIKGGMAGKFSQHDLAAWSALEAKYSLATLLSRPKSMTGNIIGGTLNTLISTGFSPLARAQNLVELRKAHPEFVTMEDWHKWAVQKGVVEDMFLNELEGGRYAGHVGMKGAITQIVKKLANDPNMDDKTLMQIAKQSGVSEELFKKAGWFMRTAERKLRLDSFFAHYLQQFDNLSPYVGGNDAHSSLKFDSPVLIEMAKKGIKATQFLYSAPFRPMFSSSSLGKIMTRFQMYAYNSIDFRKNIMNMAGIYGFQEGTNEFERMRRLIIADMVSLAAANAFMYSVFDNNLPAPWTWVQDLANWLFGNERERDRAFYGSYPSAIAPLQIVTPPSMRLVGPTIKGMIDNDFSKISGYTIWTMFPFGPLGMDIKRSLENPMQIMDTILGLPLRGAANIAKTGVNSKTGETWTKEKKTKEGTEVEEKPKKPKINNAFMQMVPVY